MCGQRPCKKCAAKLGARKRSKTMARKKISVGNITKVAMSGVYGYGGYALGRALVNNVGSLQGNPLLGAGAQLLGALLISGMSAPAGIGMAIGGAKSAVDALAPDLLTNLGITGIGAGYGSTQIPGVAGGINGRIGKNYNEPIVKVS